MTALPTNNTTSRCGFCSNTKNLLCCSRCKFMFYCNREHELAHRSAHQPACKAVAKKRDILDAEEEKLRSHPEDGAFPANLFTTSIGHFWGIFDTRDYMRARFALVETLQKIETPDSLRAQLDHLMDLTRLCRSDNMGVRYIVPALMLRLGMGQECYDFVKWWNTTGQDYDFGSLELPFLDIRNADMFESVEYLCGRYCNLSHTVGITLLKIKLLLDLTVLRDSAIMGEKQALRRLTITGHDDLIELLDKGVAIKLLAAQVDVLYKAVNKANKHFWLNLLMPGMHLTTRPPYYSHGSIEEMQMVLQYSYDSWLETPGAIEVIQAKVKKDQSD
ncbi:hypothetical protein AOQ84DRAFT_230767 [Glonium stellatum]|uniref:MYND-type domain-containing protein n=1 Tax=Glonium stellatum TaxID=574774 RepID=A0A8E2EN74_9PEZI|nr:hypothetical protein AOQ84DRAFT_230767 [Glonium stellatum]